MFLRSSQSTPHHSYRLTSKVKGGKSGVSRQNNLTVPALHPRVQQGAHYLHRLFQLEERRTSDQVYYKGMLDSYIKRKKVINEQTAFRAKPELLCRKTSKIEIMKE